MKVLGEARDVLMLGFALKTDEIRRFAPEELKLETRRHDGDEHGFAVLGMTRFDSFYAENFPPLSFSFPLAFLGLCIRNHRGGPGLYLKRVFTPRLQSSLFRWVGGMPTRTLSMDFPTRARPGGEYKWLLSGDGAGELLGKIERESGTAGRLSAFFESPEEMVNFLWNRSSLYTGTPADLREVRLELSRPDFHPIVFDKLELGFLASDLERNRFPEAVLGSFFLPGTDVVLEGQGPVNPEVEA